MTLIISDYVKVLIVQSLFGATQYGRATSSEWFTHLSHSSVIFGLETGKSGHEDSNN